MHRGRKSFATVEGLYPIHGYTDAVRQQRPKLFRKPNAYLLIMTIICDTTFTDVAPLSRSTFKTGSVSGCVRGRAVALKYQSKSNGVIL